MTEIITFISHVTFDYLMPVVLTIGFICAVFSSILCIHFNYHYFLIHGKILWDMAGDSTINVNKVVKLNGRSLLKVGVADAIFAPAILALIGIVSSIMWPITIIFILMLIILQIQKFIFRGRHRKLMFELKLKGLYDDDDDRNS